MHKKKIIKKTKSSMKVRVIIGSTVSVILILTLAIIYLLSKDKPNSVDNSGRPTLVTKDNVEQVIDSMNKPVKDGEYEVKMNTKWIFKGNSSNAFVENSKNNNRTIYFDVVLSGSNEIVYTSPYIPVGENIKNFKLDSKLEAGAYDAYVTYHLVDDKHKEVSNLSVAISFIIN